MSRTSDRSRRHLLAPLAVALVPLALVAACGSGSSSGQADETTGVAAEAGPWTYTDDLGQTVELDERPTRIAAYGDEAAALMNFGVTPVALWHYTDPGEDSTFESLDLDGIEVVGTVYGEISLEKLAAAAPDLIVTTTYDGDTPSSMYGFKDETQLAKVREIAPVVGIEQSGTALDVIESNEELVAALGVDVDGGRVAEDRAAFEDASHELEHAAESGLSVVPIYAEDANLYYAKAPDDPALSYYESLGVDFTPVKGEDYYWEVVSWENADTYDPDIVLYSVRTSYTPEQLMDQPTFARLAAARAGQLHPWKFKSMDYPSQTEYMLELAAWLSTDRDVAS
jgi:iron complex transport system substrate-binding protein